MKESNNPGSIDILLPRFLNAPTPKNVRMFLES